MNVCFFVSVLWTICPCLLMAFFCVNSNSVLFHLKFMNTFMHTLVYTKLNLKKNKILQILTIYVRGSHNKDINWLNCAFKRIFER